MHEEILCPAPAPRVLSAELSASAKKRNLAFLFAVTAMLGGHAPARGQLIGPDSTLQGATLQFQGFGCPSGLTWINGGCGTASAATPGPSPTPAPAPTVSAACLAATPGNQSVTGQTSGGSIWGNNSSGYTTDSNLGMAAVHAGLVSPGQAAFIFIQALDTVSSFTGTSANGVTTNSYGNAWCGMRLSSSGSGTPSPAPTPAPSPAGCGAQSISWSQYQSAWGGNANLAGTYQCSGTTSSASSGGSVSVSNTSANRSGSATMTCTSGSWSLSSGSCDGTYQGVANQQFFSYTADFNTNYILTQCFYNLNYVARGMSASELNYYWNRANNLGVPYTTICNEIYGSQEAATARALGNHIANSSETNICGSPNFGYPWSLGAQGQTCKSRP